MFIIQSSVFSTCSTFNVQWLALSAHFPSYFSVRCSMYCSNRMFTVQCQMLTVHSSMFFKCSRFTVQCLNVHCLNDHVQISLLTVQHSMFKVQNFCSKFKVHQYLLCSVFSSSCSMFKVQCSNKKVVTTFLVSQVHLL